MSAGVKAFMTKVRWQFAAGLLAAMFTTGMSSATESQLNPDAVDDIRGLITYMATEMPVVQNQQSTSAQQNSIEQIARPLSDVLEGCYGTPNVADYAIALHIGLQNAVRTHTDALYISKAETQFNELTSHIAQAAQWIDYIDQSFAAQYPQADKFLDQLDQTGIVEEEDRRMTLEGIKSHNFPETETYEIENVNIVPFQYYGPYSTLKSLDTFADQVEAMKKAAAAGDNQSFWSNAPTLPADDLTCGN